MNCFIRVWDSKDFSLRAKRGGKVPGYVIAEKRTRGPNRHLLICYIWYNECKFFKTHNGPKAINLFIMKNNYLSLGSAKNMIREARGPLDFSSTECISTSTSREKTLFKVLETIETSTHNSIGELHKILIDEGRTIISCLSSQLLDRYKDTIISPFKELKLVDILIADLGFKEGATYAEICAKAIRQGLRLSPIGAALKLCLQHYYSLKSEWRYIAMDPLKDSFENPAIFKVQHNKEKSCLNAVCGFSYRYFNSSSIFKFCD